MTKFLFLLGSTGSIGETTLKLVSYQKNYKVELLTTNKNVKKIYKQALKFKVKNVVIFDKDKYQKNIKLFKNRKINVYSTIKSALKKNTKKADLTINAISGIDGLEPSLEVIQHTKYFAIANKESIICGWKFLNKELKKNNTKFIPLDSEHFSIWSLIKKEKKQNIKKIYLTASGGPFLNKKIYDLKKIKPKFALNHPN